MQVVAQLRNVDQMISPKSPNSTAGIVNQQPVLFVNELVLRKGSRLQGLSRLEETQPDCIPSFSYSVVSSLVCFGLVPLSRLFLWPILAHDGCITRRTIGQNPRL